MKKNLLFLTVVGLSITLSIPSFAAEGSAEETKEGLDLPSTSLTEGTGTEGTGGEEVTIFTEGPEGEEEETIFAGEEEMKSTAATSKKMVKGKKTYPRVGNAKGMREIRKEMQKAETAEEMIALLKEASKRPSNRQWVASQFDRLANKIREELNAHTIRSGELQYEDETPAMDIDAIKAEALNAVAPYGTKSDLYKKLKSRLDAVEFGYLRSQSPAQEPQEVEEVVGEEGAGEELVGQEGGARLTE
ncbi:MAG TPA: hypothetical protein VGT41_04760 [Candidatus Babeliales bacterium]|nr:hypothetical protein [Candidatus Babeliales bacterium]